MAERRYRGTSRVVALGSRHWRAFCGTSGTSPGVRRLRSGPLAPLLPRRGGTAYVAPRFVGAGIIQAVAGSDAVPVLRRHVRSVALVCCATSLRQLWRIHRARALLL